MKIALRRIVVALLIAIVFSPAYLRAQSDGAEPNALLLQSQADADRKSTGCLKDPHFGESYDADGKPRRLVTFPAPTAEEIEKKGILPQLEPLQRWEISQPGNVLRVFERGGRKRSEVGNPDPEEDPGKPEIKLS